MECQYISVWANLIPQISVVTIKGREREREADKKAGSVAV